MFKGFVAGVLTANAFEWFAHKYVLHGVPRKGQPRYSPHPPSMNSHWAHHRMVRKTEFADECYEQGLHNERTRLEVTQLAVLAGVMTVFWPVSKGFVIGTWYSAANYYYVHSRSHLSPEWAKKRIPWHYDHHMNTIQDANWCVTRPWFDYLMGTREASSAELMESNPLGLPLPKIVEAPLNAWSRRLLPKVFERVEANIRLENDRRAAERLGQSPEPTPDQMAETST